jgi:hypothetical protein
MLMPKVTVTVPHDKEPEHLVEKVKPAIEKTVQDFQGHDVQSNWTDRGADFSFKSMAFTIKGKVAIDEKQVVVDVELPFAAMMFKDRAEKAITKNLTRALEG